MDLKNTFKTALEGLRTNKLRSGLTILGVVIGVVAIITVISVTEGAKGLILNQIESMGAELVVLRPGREPKGPTDFTETMMSNSLKTRDVEALKKKENVPGLVDIAPSLMVPGGVSREGETFRATVIGWSAEWLVEMFNIYPEEGVLFSEDDIKRKESVAVIGQRVKEELFGFSDAVGERIKIKDRAFKVVGVLPKKGQVFTFNIDELVIIPYTTAQTYILGIDYYHEILIKAKDEASVPGVIEDVKRTLREMHGIDDPEKDDFFVMGQTDIAERLNIVTGVLTLLLVSVAAISLTVGGIGVMNIMLVSVTERTHEIGLRKAVGATNRDILNQFLFEAIVLAGVGGIIGIVLGGAISFIISFILSKLLGLDWTFVFPVFGALLGIGVSSFVGLIFGLYPARKAAAKDPIDALRYE